MSEMNELEEAIGRYLFDLLGEHWPLTAWVLYGVQTDLESAEFEQPVTIVPEGQRAYVTLGLLEQAQAAAREDSLPSISFVDISDFDEEDD